MIIPRDVKKKQTIFGYNYIEASIIAMPFLISLYILESSWLIVVLTVLLGFGLVNKVSSKRLYIIIKDQINYIQSVTYFFRDRDVFIEDKFTFTPKQIAKPETKLEKLIYPIKLFMNTNRNTLIKIKIMLSKRLYVIFNFKDSSLNDGEFDKYDLEIDYDKQVIITQNGKKFIVKKLIPKYSKWFDNEEEKDYFYTYLYRFYNSIEDCHIYKYHDSSQLEFNDFDTKDNLLLELYKKYQLSQYEKVLDNEIPYYFLVFPIDEDKTISNINNGEILDISDPISSDIEIIDSVILGNINDIQEVSIKNDHVVLLTNEGRRYYQKYIATTSIALKQNEKYIENLMKEINIDVKLSFKKYDDEEMKKIMDSSAKESSQRIYNTDKSSKINEEYQELEMLAHYLDCLNKETDSICGFKLLIKIESEELEDLELIEKDIQRKYENLKLTSELFTQKDNLMEWTLLKEPKKYKELIMTDFVYGGLFDYSTMIDQNGFIKFIGEKGIVSWNSTLVSSSVNRQKSNIFISGSTGSGKSTLIKMLILEYMSMGRNVINVDVQGDFRELFKQIGGVNLDISDGHIINPLEVTDWRSTRAPIKKHISYLEAFFAVTGSVDEQVINVISYELVHFYDKYNLTKESKSEDYPIMEDFYNYLVDKGIDESITMYIHKYYKGTYSDIFNGHTTIDLSSNYINFCIESTKDDERNLTPLLFCIFNIINEKMYDPELKLSIIFDEFHRMLRSGNSKTYVETGIKEARKFNSLIAMVSQSIEQIPKDMIDQTQYIVYLKNPNMDSVAESIGKEKSMLMNLSKAQFGEGILKIDETILPINFNFSKREILENIKLLSTFDSKVIEELDELDKIKANKVLSEYE